MQTLHDILDALLDAGNPDLFKQQVPSCIYSNLKAGYGQRLYQQEAFGRFIYFLNDYQDKPNNQPLQLLYHMATGSGKTIIMAGLILYLYSKGYRNFLFFVNSTNIIEKTKDNFLNPASSKYLFSDLVSRIDKRIEIKEVSNFQISNPEDINIVFSTIQGLHSQLNEPKENSLTYDDFEEKKIVLISDEAHHINAETKRGNELGTEEKEEIISWEGTVNRIFNAHRENILLEFTATADLSVPEIATKYSNKLIFDYPLKQFRIDGYSKEVKVLQADLPAFERALLGVLLSQYRRKIFEKYGKPVKPVILFKSKTIKESHAFYDLFVTGIKQLNVAGLEKVRNVHSDPVIENVFRYLEVNNISLEDFITELREDFSEDKLISVNSRDESEQKQLAINSLEDEDNIYRAIFAVDKLNEGWDVLNLFDIVRLYNTRDSKAGKPGKTTMTEAQLIGRGARYCPFRITPEQPLFQRKYDDTSTHELRICEELYYYSAYNPQYIRELNTAMEETGIKSIATAENASNKKNAPKKVPSYKEEINNADGTLPLTSLFHENIYKIDLKTGVTRSGTIQSAQTDIPSGQIKEKEYLLTSFGKFVIRKAINKLPFYQFSHLKTLFPGLNSISEFITSDKYLGKIKIKVYGLPEQIENLTTEEKLAITIEVLENISIKTGN